MDMKKIKAVLLMGVLLLLAGLSVSGLLEKGADALGADTFHAGNRAYIEQSFDTSMKGFLILSAIKSGLAVIEGSEVGIGFNLQVGDLVQSVYDYVDIAWKTALMGGTVLLLTQLLFQAVALVNHWFLGLVFALPVLWISCRFLRGDRDGSFSMVRRMFAMATIVTVSLYVIFPVSVHCAAWLSKRITNPLMTEARDGFVSVKDELSVETLSRKLLGDESNNPDTWMDRLNLGTQYTKVKKHLADLGEQLAKTAEKIAVWTVTLIAGYLFDALIFPLTFLLMLYLFTRFSFDYLLAMGLPGNGERRKGGL